MRSKALSVCLVLPSLAPGRPQVALDASTLLDTLLKAEQLQNLSFLQSWDWADHGQRWEPEEHTKPGKRAKFDVTVSRYLAVSYHFSTLLMRRSPEWLGPLIAAGQENKLRGVGSLGSLIHQHLGGESERAGTSPRGGLTLLFTTSTATLSARHGNASSPPGNGVLVRDRTICKVDVERWLPYQFYNC